MISADREGAATDKGCRKQRRTPAGEPARQAEDLYSLSETLIQCQRLTVGNDSTGRVGSTRRNGGGGDQRREAITG